MANLTAGHSICYVTPTHIGDFERFKILRQSIELFSPNMPHIALVDTEDLEFFKDKFSGKNLSFIPSKDILPETLEKKRGKVKKYKGTVLEKLGRRFGFELEPLNGWRLQQFLKIYFLANTAYENCVFLDSDILICDTIDSDYYFDGNGNLKILETISETVEDHGFSVSTCVLMGMQMQSNPVLYNYIHQAPRFRASTGKILLTHLKNTHGEGVWQSRFIHQQWPSEYGLFGFVARQIEQFEGYCQETLNPEEWLYQIRYRGDELMIDSCLEKCLTDECRRKFMLIQSNLGISDREFYGRISQLVIKLHNAT